MTPGSITLEKQILLISGLVSGYHNDAFGIDGSLWMCAQQGLENMLPQCNDSLYIWTF